MDQNLIKLLPYTKPYKKHIVWNVTFNILYALFSTISLITMFPLLEVLFGKNEQISKVPVYTGILNIVTYTKDIFIKKHIQFLGILSHHAPKKWCFK